MQRACPKCGFDHATERAECARCGVVFAKLDQAPRASLSPTAIAGEDEPAARPLTRDALRPVAIGLAVAAVVSLIPFLRFVFGYFGVLVHELGHAVCAWVFGYPAIPAFNFQHGGGVTSIEERKLLLMLLIYAGLAYAIYRYRHHTPALVAFGCLTAVYSMVALTSVHQLLIDFMGHGFELLFVGLFLYRALDGTAAKLEAERPAYAFVAFFLLFYEVGFAFGLATSHEKRVEYEIALSGITGDLIKIASRLDTSLASVGSFYLLLTALPVVLGFAAYRYRDRLLHKLCWLLDLGHEDRDLALDPR